MIFDAWTISLNHPTAGAHVCNETFADNLVFDSSKEDPQQFMRTLLDQQFIFTGSDYIYLKAIEDGGDRCDEISLTVASGSFSRTYLISVVGAEFDEDLGQVQLKPRVDDRYQCILDNWEDKVSIFTTPSTTVELYQGTIEVDERAITALPDINNPPPPSTDPTDPNWQVLILDASFALSTWAGTITYVRQTIDTTCSSGVPVAPVGTGWTLRVDDCGGSGTATYSKKVPLIRDPDEEYIGTSDRRRDYKLVPGYDVDTDTTTTIDNGRLLMRVLQNWYAATCSGNVVTDLFNWNAPSTAPSNDVYDQIDNVAELVILQRSDVKRASAFQNATQGNISPKEILEGLWTSLQAIWWVDDSGDLRIEHNSILGTGSAFDFTSTNAEQIAGTNIYESLQDDFPRNQLFTWDESYGQRDFSGDPLNYPNACSDGEETFPAPWSTDVGSILATPDVASDAGFVLMASIEVSGTYYLPTEAGAITGTELLNGHLAWANLQEVYHQHRRPFLAGVMNGSAHTFTSAKKGKAQEVSVIMSLSDYETFLTALEDPTTSSEVTTGLGVGEVERATYDVKNQTLTLTLNHA